jgi:hypothetical protein
MGWSTIDINVAFADEDVDVGAIAARVGSEDRAAVRRRHVTGGRR